MNLRAQRIAFAAASRLTDLAPALGARLLDATIRPAIGNRVLSAIFARRNRAVARRVGAFRRFLVIPDIHIGDALMTQSALTAIRDFFPAAEVDYVVNRAMAPLIEGDPETSRVIPLFAGAQFPSPADLDALREIIRVGRYDLCLSFSPFVQPGDVAAPGQPFLEFVTHGPTLVRNEAEPAEVNHFSYQIYRFVRGALSTVAPPVRPPRFEGARATFADQPIEQAFEYAAAAARGPDSPVIMLNPDSASRFNLVPFEHQAALLERVARDSSPDTVILVGAGHSWPGIGERLAGAVSPAYRGKCRIIPPSMPLGVYAALIDRADVFVSGDTGPLHLAAARRYSRSGRHRFRNRTAVLSVFGATMSRMSGYDSSRPGYLPANQDAPSWCYVAGSPCRNITCLNKYFKTCRTVRCFEQLAVDDLARLVVSHVATVVRQAAARRHADAPERVPAWREPAPT
jgi:heptosyltransferase-1